MITSFEPTIFLILKVTSIIGLVIYAIFAAVIVRQEQLMAGVLEEGFEPVLRLITLIHFLSAVGLILLASVLL